MLHGLIKAINILALLFEAAMSKTSFSPDGAEEVCYMKVVQGVGCHCPTLWVQLCKPLMSLHWVLKHQ